MPKWFRSLAIVLAVVGLATLVSRLPRPSTKPKAPPVPKEIERFSLQSADHALSLENVKGSWRVTSPLDLPANEGTVLGFLASLRSLELKEVLSRRPDSFGIYQLDDASSVRLTVWAPGAHAPLAWRIGKESPSGGHIYVRIGDAPEAYLAKGMSRSVAGAGLKFWRDPRVLPLPPDIPIHSLQARRGQGNLMIEKSSDTWTVNGKKANHERVDSMLSSLRYLSADDFVDPPDSGPLAAQLANAPTRLTVLLESGVSVLLRFGPPEQAEDSRVLVRRDEDPHLYRVDSRHVDLLTLTEKELLSK